jgi:anti-sigma B factor antagonist
MARRPDDREAGMQINEEQQGVAWGIAVRGRVDSNSAGGLGTVLPARVQTQVAVVVDLAAVAHGSSAGLCVFLKGAKAAKATGHRLVLTGLSPSVREVFDISGFSSLFAIESDLGAGLAALG